MPHGPQATRHHLQRGAHSENGNEGLLDSRALVVLYKKTMGIVLDDVNAWQMSSGNTAILSEDDIFVLTA